MKNVETKIDGKILTIKVDLSKTFGPSKSGKTEGLVPYKFRTREFVTQ